VGHRRSGAGGCRRECVGARLGAVVVTLTVTLVGVLPLGVTLVGDTVQVASEGAPVQVNEMLALSPPTGATAKV